MILMDLNDSIFTVIGTFFTAILSAIIVMIGYNHTKKNQYRQIYSENVSKTRNEWLNHFRESVSGMLAYSQQGQNKSDKYYKCRNDLVTRLNMSEKLHVYLYCLILKLDNSSGETYDNLRDKILETTQLIIKEEWEKVKEEAKGGLVMSNKKYIHCIMPLIYILMTFLIMVFVAFFLVIVFKPESNLCKLTVLTMIIFSLLLLTIFESYKLINVCERKENCRCIDRKVNIEEIKKMLKDLEQK